MAEYFKGFARELWDGFKEATAEQVIGLLLAVTILVYQIKFGAVHAEDRLSSIRALAWPYVDLALALLVWQLVKTPYKLDQTRAQEIEEIREALRVSQERVHQLECEIVVIRNAYSDNRPKLGLRVSKQEGSVAWLGFIGQSGPSVSFYIRHLGGRFARQIQFDPIASRGGRFSLRIQPLPFLAERAEWEVSFEIWEADKRPESKIIERIGWGSLFANFVFDGPSGEDILEFPITTRFQDQDPETMEYIERTEQFKLVFDVAKYSLGVAR
jgi:hypothetical protein